jgi:hypothetical protein
VQGTCGSPDGTWHNNNVTLYCTYTDGGSGLASQQISLKTNVAAGSETVNANASANGAQACDAVGNCATSPADIGGNMIDLKAPNVSCGATDGSWHATDKSVSCTVTDGGSGPATQSVTLSTNVPAGTETSNASTNSEPVCDAVNNCATAGPVSGFMIDKKAPSVSCGAADGDWHATDVNIACTANDGGSGLAGACDANFDLSTGVSAGTEDPNASTGTHNVCDGVDHFSQAGPISGNMIDKKAPSFGSCPVAGPFPLNSGIQPVGPITANEYGSGLDDDSSTLTGSVNTSSVGSKTVTFTALDNIGNSSTKNCIYDVTYNFLGFFQPIDSSPTVNTVKNGSTVPVKWKLQDANGTNLTDVNTVTPLWPRTQKIDCSVIANNLADDIETTATGGTSLRYDLTAMQFIYNWQTPKQANTCWRLDVKFIDGVTKSAHTIS